jgi:hypothetical protein
MAFVGLGVLGWAFALRSLGLVPATAILIGLCVFAEPRPRFVPTVLTMFGMCAFGWLLFVRFLGLPISAWAGG